MGVKSIKIENIELSRRSYNALRRAGVETVGDLLEYTEDSLSKIRNLGRKSIDEVLLKIEEYQKYEQTGDLPYTQKDSEDDLPEVPKDFMVWCRTDDGKTYILSWLARNEIKIDALEALSVHSYNLLFLSGLKKLDQVIFLSMDELMEIPRMKISNAGEISKKCLLYLEEHKADILDDLKKRREEIFFEKGKSLRDMLYRKENHDRILKYVQSNDCTVDAISFSVRARNRLIQNGYFMLSDFIFVSKREMSLISGMGIGSLKEIQSFIDAYLLKHEADIIAVCSDDNSDCGCSDAIPWDEKEVQNIILKIFNRIGFGGLSLRELKEQPEISEKIPEDILKPIIGSLLADRALEYVDFRCYRVYPKFGDYLAVCSVVSDRSKDIISGRLKGETLETIASGYGMTRERVRQIVKKDFDKVRKSLQRGTGIKWFDEDYYRYFYETYAFEKKDAGKWLGIDETTFNYLEMAGNKKGTRDLREAENDHDNLDYGFRLKIKNYLNRDKLFLDGRWIERNRSDIEDYVIRTYCKENVSFSDFCRIYNNFLRKEEVAYDERIYYTEPVQRTRRNRLAESKLLLWKYGEQFRYYDIEGHDYTELLNELNLDAYENIEYSTEKFIMDHPEVMKKYDIRDRYELHNLFRKIIPEGSYHDFHCLRSPNIEFGSFDMEGALLDLLIDHAPISMSDFAELVHEEYGFDPATVQGSYLQPFSAYYHQGMYTIDQKAMTSDHKAILLKYLTDDFYYIDEIRRIYASVVPDADPEEINPYNLKSLGFSVLSRYVYRNYNSLDEYFRHILTQEDITDITAYRKRFAYVQAFSVSLVTMKKEMEILEFEPNQIICFRKLEEAGISKMDLNAFCEEVYNFEDDNTYFSIQSVRKSGFTSNLFDLGFSDWFYANLLAADNRFSYSTMFGNIILFKGDERISIKSFEETLIKEYGSIDVYDLMTEMEEVYGCRIPDRLDVIYKVDGTDVYHDKYLDRLYANKDIFNQEVDEMEGL